MRKVEISEIGSLLENYDETTLSLILTRNGRSITVLLPIEDVDIETLSISTNPRFTKIIEQSRESQKTEGRIFLEDIELPIET